MQALAPKLSAEQAQAALGPVLAAMRGHHRPRCAGALARAVQALPPAHRRAGAGGARPRPRRHTGHHRPRALEALARAVQALARELTAEQAQAALDPVLAAMQEPPLRCAVGAGAGGAGPGREAQRRAGAGGARPRPRRHAGGHRPRALRTLAEAVQALAAGSPPSRRRRRSAPSWSQAGDHRPLCAGGAGAGGRALPRSSRLRRRRTCRAWRAPAWGLPAIALRLSPGPGRRGATSTSAGERVRQRDGRGAEIPNHHDATGKDGSDGEPASATEYLIRKLRERFPGHAELQGGNLKDALAWIAGNYPEVDLTSPPERPAFLDEIVFSPLRPALIRPNRVIILCPSVRTLVCGRA